MPLYPAVYAHIFKPGVRLTSKERQQLLDIHHGRHTLIVDDEFSLEQFLAHLEALSRNLLAGRFLAFCLIAAQSGTSVEGLENAAAACPGVLTVYPVFGEYDYVAILSVDDYAELLPIIATFNGMEGIRLTSTYLVAKNLDDEFTE